jgi:hypothetical protein
MKFVIQRVYTQELVVEALSPEEALAESTVTGQRHWGPPQPDAVHAFELLPDGVRRVIPVPPKSCPPLGQIAFELEDEDHPTVRGRVFVFAEEVMVGLEGYSVGCMGTDDAEPIVLDNAGGIARVWVHDDLNDLVGPEPISLAGARICEREDGEDEAGRSPQGV